MTMTVAEVNSLDREGFIAALGGIFEHSPWVAERAWASRPFATLAGLHETMVRAVERASLEQQLSLIRAHPDLGTRAKMSEASAGEQAVAALDRLAAGELEGLQAPKSRSAQEIGVPVMY